jgi:hypothetical protein
VKEVDPQRSREIEVKESAAIIFIEGDQSGSQ